MDIPAEKSVERAMDRYRKGMELHRNGAGDGGRLVPPPVILAQRAPDGGTIDAYRAGELTLDELAQRLHDRVWPAPRPAARSAGELYERELEDPEPAAEGSFDEVVNAYHAGQITGDEYKAPRIHTRFPDGWMPNPSRGEARSVR